MVYNCTNIITHFNVRIGDFEIKPFGHGHINDTFLVRSTSAGGSCYLLQRINNFVFKDIDGLMNNMGRVIDHLKEKVTKTQCGEPEKNVLTLVIGNDGKYYHTDEQGNYWRMTLFLEGTRSYDLVTTGKQAYQGGLAFGNFQYLLSDLDPAGIVEVIPGFLNIDKRLTDFYNAIQQNKIGRLENVIAEVEFLCSWSAVMRDMQEQGEAGILPLRITHNDTKFNNILLDKNNDIQCVIDLDTVMPGYVAYDFGDAIRSIINTAAEDEKDLDAIQLNFPLFTEFTKGYLSQVRSFLTKPELRSLITGVLLLPYLQAVRFLTDHLTGDVYYKTYFAGHNLQRTRAQIQLFKMLELNRDKLSEIVNTEWARLQISSN